MLLILSYNIVKYYIKGDYLNMDMNTQNFPILDKHQVVMDTSITNARHAYNLLQKNKLMSKNKSVYTTREKIEVLCNKKLGGVIPSLLTSALHYPDPIERVVFRLVLCQYAKSKLMSCSDNSLNLNIDEIQAEINKLNEDFFDAYKNYLVAKDYPITITSSKDGPVSFSLETNSDGRLLPKCSQKFYTTTTTNNENLTDALKKLKKIYMDAKDIHDKIQQKVDFNQIKLNKESIKDFAIHASCIARPVASSIEEENSKRILSKWIRYAFSFKGDWANEETILTISKLS